MSHRRVSVASIVVAILVAVTTVLLGTYGVINHVLEKDRQLRDLRSELQGEADQLSTDIALPIWNIDREQIDKVIESAFNDPDIYGVEVAAAGRIHARIRDGQWRVVAAPGVNPAPGLLEEDRAVTFSNETIGTVKVYSSPRFVEGRLRKTLFSTFAIVILLELILTVSLYFLLWRVVLRPLKSVEQYAASVSSGNGAAPAVDSVHFRGELEGLRLSIKKMVDLLELRFVQLQEKVRQQLESEAHYRALVENTPDIIAGFDREGRYLFVNSSISHASAIAPKDFIGKSMRDVGFSDRQIAVREKAIREVFATGAPFESEFRFEGPGGMSVYDWRVYPVLDNAGDVLTVYSISRDITERKLAEDTMREQVTFDELANRVLSGFASASGERVDESIHACLAELGRFMRVEEAFINLLVPDKTSYDLAFYWHDPTMVRPADMFQRGQLGSTRGWAEQMLLRGEVFQISTLDDFPGEAAQHRELLEQQGVKSVLNVPLVGKGGLVHGALGLRSHARSVSWSSQDVRRVRMLADSVANVLERKRAEEALRDSMNQLHSLATRLENIREDERKSISREVHDELGQVLTALKMDLMAVKQSGMTDATLLEERVNSMLGLAGSAIKTVQDISTKLRPGMLDDLGLAAAVEWQVEDFQKRTGVTCKLTLPDEDLDLDDKRSTVLFRILQETLTNIARHANAKNISVTLSEEEDAVLMSVSDDGVGISESQLESPKSIGLLGIRERLHPFEGICIIQRRANGGTQVSIRLPKTTSEPHRP